MRKYCDIIHDLNRVLNLAYGDNVAVYVGDTCY